MKYVLSDHRHALAIVNSDQKLKALWDEVIAVIESISDHDVHDCHVDNYAQSKSLSLAINQLLKERFVAAKWSPESPIFQSSDYSEERWRLDFAKEDISIEVAFNHGEAIAWNLLKPVLASELNHVQKAIQTKIGVIICATEAMKREGGFDSAVGEYEKFIRYLKPLNNVLTVPVILIGLEPLQTLYVTHNKQGRKNIAVLQAREGSVIWQEEA